MPASKEGPAAARLRAFVRERVHKEGALYERGSARALARAIGKPQSWVSHYVDENPLRNADLDTALALCAFYGVELTQFSDRSAAPPRSESPAVPASKNRRRAERALDRMSEQGLREAADLLAGLARAYPRAPEPAHKRRAGGTTSGKGRKGFETA